MKALIRFILGSALLLTSCTQLMPTSVPGPSNAATFTLTSERIKEIDALAQSTLEQTPLAGLTIGIRSGGSVYLQSYGLADRESGQRAQNETIYYVGSLTKQFTAAAIMQLVEQNKVRLDDPISRYIPGLPNIYRTATIHQLLSHTSGIPNIDQSDLTGAGLDPRQTYEPSQLLSRLAAWHTRPLDFAPGTSWRYSNTGYFLLGMVIEQASGRTYGEYLRENIFNPLDLTSMAYCTTPPAALAKGYALQAGQLVPAPFLNPSINFAAGSICGTAGDLLKWQAALAQGRVVSPAAYERMTTPQSAHQTGVVPDIPFYQEMTNYGYGLFVATRCGRRVIFHGGALVTGYLALVSYYPDDDLAVVLLTNTYSNRLSLSPEGTDSIALERSLVCQVFQK